MSEGITIPKSSEIILHKRKKPEFDPKSERYYPYKLTDDTLIPPMAEVGEGFKIFTTGLTHDERGYPATTPEYQKITIKRLHDKIEKNKDDICKYEEFMTEDAEILIVAFGIVSRVAKGAVLKARKMGYKVGLFRPITLWPVADNVIKFLAEKVNHIIVAEINNGQYLHEVERFGFGKAVFHFIPHYGGSVHTINEFMKKIKQLQVYEVLE
jgi:2-oxoglutarate ferredoxin oxidoreductase subunit alpha